MHRLFPVIFLLGSLYGYSQQAIEKYVRENVVQLASVQPDSTDYTDLEVIGKAIGDAKIVMLGEQDHGDAPAFLAKTRLIKYLHEKKGFNVLAFESDFFGLNEGWDQLPKTKDSINPFLSRNIFGIWTWCDACIPLFYNYIPATWETTHPLMITGFDNQQILTYANKNLARKLDSVLKKLNLPVTGLPEYATEIFHVIDTIARSYFLPKGDDAYRKRKEYLQMIRDQLTTRLPANDFWLMVVDNLMAANRQYSERSKDQSITATIRDVQMARNLQWLTDVKFANEKIIVWAHNYHISKHAGYYPEKVINKTMTMGTAFTGDTTLMKKTYVMGFTSYEGMAGRISMKPYEIKKPDKDGFETWIDPSWNYGFIDFKKYNLSRNNEPEQFSLKGSVSAMHQSMNADWTLIFDGMFYIRNMYPCNRISKIE
jgi:erythromycin esterase